MKRERPFIRCLATTNCTRCAAVQIYIGGVLAFRHDPVNTCRMHRGLVIDHFLTISNDVRVRLAV